MSDKPEPELGATTFSESSVTTYHLSNDALTYHSSLITNPMPFSTRIKIRFGDTDPAGLVYYPNIFHYFHIAMEEFFATQCGVGYDQLVTAERIGFPTVNIQTEFRAPILYGDEIDIEVFVSRPGRTSAIFEYRVTRVSDGQLCAQSTQVHVAMNLDTRRPVPLPEKFREAFSGATS